MVKNTVFFDVHKALDARIKPFAGFNMPVEYSGVIDEHLNVRRKLGIFDVSHMGEIWVKGEKAKDFIQKVTTNDVSSLSPGKVQYSCFPNGNGGIIDDILVYQYSDTKYLLVVNASNIDKDWNWLVSQNNPGVVLENASDHISQVAVQGPLAVEALQKLTDIDLANLKSFTFITAPFAGIQEVIISATGYTGSGGLELYFYNDYGPAIWNKIMEAGRSYGIKPAGLAARDTLRLEMGYCLYGNDIDDTTSPIEAGLGWITKFSEGNDFIDRNFLEMQKARGVKRKLVGFEMIDKGIPRQHYEVHNNEGEIIGKVTSGTISPVLNKGIGMAYVLNDFASEGNDIIILIRNKNLKARIVQPPFFKGI